MFIAYASRQGPNKPVQMRGLSRAFTACIQSMQVDVKAQSRQNIRCSQTRSMDVLKVRS